MVSPQLYRRAIPAAARITDWTAPDGHTLRRFDWPAKARADGGGVPRGRMLFQGGRGDIFEKYLETFAHWQALGWSITSFDWRGQGGSGRLSPNAHVGHIDDFQLYIDDYRAFWNAWVAEGAGPHVALGHSMGGHLLLRALVEQAVTPDAAVLVAPMLALHSPLGSGPLGAVLGERMARIIGGLGNVVRPAWRGNELPATTETRQDLLTHDQARYSDEIFWQTSKPELLLGPPSWRWVIEAFASTRTLRADPRLATLDVPVLFVVADNDKLVAPKAAFAIADTLADARMVRFGMESAHEILREVDSVRDRALSEIDRFLAERASSVKQHHEAV